ncbi:MAG: lytic transglycosylase domain-containing protein [Chitinophagaceae bacterium]|nr:lytic transglycosylase domain-containing protein [Chitinophagaceae bacterium]
MRVYFNKNIFLVKTLLGVAMVLFASANVKAASAHIKADTSKKLLLAAVKKEAAYITIPANVVYPSILVGNEDESKDYVEKFSENRRDYLIRMYKKGKTIFPKVTKTFKKYNVPQEFKVLIALESAFNGNAVSGAGAVGYWQIMDEVAKEYGLKYIPQPTAEEKKLALKQKALKVPDTAKAVAKKPTIKDERKNFARSTQTAARYLRDRCKNLNNNWLLVVASYNCGIGNVWDAMRKTGKTNPSFWDVKPYLPAETRNYVMNFIALNVVYHNYEKFAGNNLNFNSVKIKADEDEVLGESGSKK